MRLPLFLCFLCFPMLLFGQSVVGNFSMRNKPNDFAYKISRSGKPVRILFQNDEEYEIMSIDSSFTFSKSLTYKQLDKNNRFIGSLETDSALSLYFIQLKTGRFSALSISKADTQMVWNTLFNGNSKEHFLKAIVAKDQMQILSVDETTQNLIVKTYKHAEKISENIFKIEFPDFMNSLKANLNMLNQEPFSDIGITYIDYEIEQDISDIYTDRKMYVRDDKLVLVFDQQNTSHLLIVDLTKKKSYYKKFSFKLELETSENANAGNSFLYKEYFFRITSNGHQINLAVIDFRNFKLIRNHNIFDNQPIEIKNGPILFEESTNGSVPSIKPISTTQKFFKLVRGADLGVTARQNPNNTLELTIGSHLSEVYTSPAIGSGLSMGLGSFGLGMGGVGMSVGVGGSMDPFYYPYGMGSRSYSVSIEKAYFHTVLTDKEFAHVPMPLQNSYLDRKKTFLVRNFKASKVPDIEVEYQWNDKIHYGYWDRKTNKFIVLAFDK